MHTRVRLVAAVAALPLLLTGCGFFGGDDAASDATSSPTATAEPSSSESPIGGDPAVWAPVEINIMKRERPVEVVTGQRVVIMDVPEGMGYELRITPPQIARTEGPPGRVMPGASPTLIARAPGTGEFTLYRDGEQVGRTVTLIVSPRTSEPSE